jgi:hypothetical protein
MKLEMFTEVQLKQDIPEYNLTKNTPAIIVDYLPRETGENGYVLEILDENGNGYDVIAVTESQIYISEMIAV